MTSALVLFGFFACTLMLSNAAVLEAAKEPIAEDNDVRTMDDALQKAYAQRYRFLLENLAEAALEHSLPAENMDAAWRPLDKRAQTFVRFGKRAQTFVRFGRDALSDHGKLHHRFVLRRNNWESAL